MSLTTRPAGPEDDARWDEFVELHPHGSPFHLSAWRKSIEATYGYEPRYLLAGEGARLRGVLPLFRTSSLLTGSALISSPFAVYGGILAADDEARKSLADAAAALGRELRVQYVEFRNAYAEQCAGFEPVTRYVTFTQQIADNNDAVLKAIPRKTRAMVRKALKHPIETRTADRFETFFDLYSKNLRRLGTPCFPRRHFRELLKNFAGAIDVREVVLEGKVIAAVMSLYFRDRVLPYYGASDPAYNAYAPNNFMYYDLMRSSKADGRNIFDFGRSKKGSGSGDFKAHWGMEMRDLPYEMLLVRRKDLPNFSPNNPKYQMAIRAWTRVPLPITRAVGPWLVKLVP